MFPLPDNPAAANSGAYTYGENDNVAAADGKGENCVENLVFVIVEVYMDMTPKRLDVPVSVTVSTLVGINEEDSIFVPQYASALLFILSMVMP